MTKTLVGKLRCWLFPFEEEAERQSTKAVKELEDTIANIRQIRTERMMEHHHLLAMPPQEEGESTHVIRASD